MLLELSVKMANEALEKICRAKDILLEEKKAEQRKIIATLKEKVGKDGKLDVKSLEVYYLIIMLNCVPKLMPI